MPENGFPKKKHDLRMRFLRGGMGVLRLCMVSLLLFGLWIDLSKKLDLIFKLEDLSSTCLKVASQIRVLRGGMRVWGG